MPRQHSCRVPANAPCVRHLLPARFTPNILAGSERASRLRVLHVCGGGRDPTDRVDADANTDAGSGSLRGDCNGDGTVDVTEVIRGRRHCARNVVAKRLPGF